MVTIEDSDYEEIRHRVERAAYNHSFSSTDADDMVQDVCVKILEEGIPPKEWNKVISHVIGSYRRDRTRALDREVRFT